MMLEQNDVISPEQAGTLYGLFLERVRRSPERVAYRYCDNEVWLSLTWQQMAQQVARWQTALAQLELNPGDRVGVMLRNCPYWVMFDLAAMSLGLVVVPLYTMDRPDNIAYIVNDASIRVLLFDTAEQWQALAAVQGQLNPVLCFISIQDFVSNCDRHQTMNRFLPASADLAPPVPCSPQQLVSLIYTSGTTGKPKGVMLSHWNMLSNADASFKVFPVRADDRFLSFLPLSHTFERTVGYYLAMMAGAEVAYARSIPQLSEDLQTIRPTLLISVPRIYERIYAAVKAKLEQGSPLTRALFHFTVQVGWARFLHAQGRGAWSPSFLLWPLLHQLVASKVLNRLGGQLRLALSGGAALSPDIARVFIGLGLCVIQGYGMTETSPVICGNRPDNNHPDSVGQPLKDVLIKLGPQQELLVKGPNVMLGYWNNPAATQAMIDADGWLNTGDVVRIAESGHVYITGRTKEIIVMSNGEKIPPSDMELAILQDSLFEQVMMVGEARPYLVVLTVLNLDHWTQLAYSLNLDPQHPDSLEHPQVLSQVLARVHHQLASFPGYARVHRVKLLLQPWTIESGLLTPTLKLKRQQVSLHFSAEIEQLYHGH